MTIIMVGMAGWRLERSGFVTIQDAKAWTEPWIAYCAENTQLKKTVDILREQRQKDFQEIIHLRMQLLDAHQALEKYQDTRDAESTEMI